MNNKKLIRFKQRFKNFEKAFNQLKEAIDNFDNLSVLEKEGLVQRFEYTFELSWKVLKDYLESKGIEVKFPRDVLKEAFQAEIISNGEIWFEMLEYRNILTHTYNEENFVKAVNKIYNSFYTQIKTVYNYLKNEQ